MSCGEVFESSPTSSRRVSFTTSIPPSIRLSPFEKPKVRVVAAGGIFLRTTSSSIPAMAVSLGPRFFQITFFDSSYAFRSLCTSR